MCYVVTDLKGREATRIVCGSHGQYQKIRVLKFDCVIFLSMAVHTALNNDTAQQQQ